MENRIEQEINKTLQCMDNSLDFQVSPLFAENLSSRIANMRISRGVGYRNRIFYPAAIVLLIALNLVICLTALKNQRSADSVSSQATVLAYEYGIGQSEFTAF